MVMFLHRGREKSGARMWKLVGVSLLFLASPRVDAQVKTQPDEQARILTLESAWNQAVQQ